MPVIVTCDIFSGRPNPTWELSAEQINEFKNQLYLLTEKALLKTPSIYYGLGYRGFIVDSVGESDIPKKILINANLVDIGWDRESFLDKEHQIEKWLLKTASFRIDAKLNSLVMQWIEDKKNDIGFYLDKSNFNPRFFSEPVYNPGWWNNDETILRNNNCYNYACNIVTNTFAQPGRGSGTIHGSAICQQVSPAADRDGLDATSLRGTPTTGHYAALVVFPSYDFHWYRRDINGMWSHKPGQTPVKNTDDVGALISDPETCARGNYTDFCSYFLCDPAIVTIN